MPSRPMRFLPQNAASARPCAAIKLADGLAGRKPDWAKSPQIRAFLTVRQRAAISLRGAAGRFARAFVTALSARNHTINRLEKAGPDDPSAGIERGKKRCS